MADQASEAEGNQVSAPVTLTGRVGADPELKFSKTGTAVLNLRVVTNGRRKTDAGWEDVDTTWWRVSAFKQLAENAAESLSTGDLVIITGKVKAREWMDKDGGKQVSWEVTADHIGVDLVRVKASSSRVERASKPAVDDPWSQQDDVAPF